MGLSDVLSSIKEAELAAAEKIESSKEKASKILTDARKNSAEIIQNAQDGAITSTTETLDSARGKAGKEADTVQTKGAKVVAGIKSSAGERRTAAVQILMDSLMSN